MVMFGSSYLVLHLLIGHLANKEFRPYQTVPFVLTLVMMFFALFFCIVFPEGFMHYELIVWYSIALYLLINSLVTFAAIVRQMESHFGIKAFDITDKVKDQ
jgi:predicted membrane chloride channel (bestrophin family)